MPSALSKAAEASLRMDEIFTDSFEEAVCDAQILFSSVNCMESVQTAGVQ